jgi:hypothetical protein
MRTDYVQLLTAVFFLPPGWCLKWFIAEEFTPYKLTNATNQSFGKYFPPQRASC